MERAPCGIRLACALATLMLICSSCSSITNSSDHDGVRVSATHPRDAAVGDTVAFRVATENLTPRPLRLELTGAGQPYTDVRVYRHDGALVWNSLHGRTVLLSAFFPVLQPGESIEAIEVWTMRANDGSLLPPGEYVVRAAVLGKVAGAAPAAQEGSPELRSSATTLTVRRP